MGAPFDGTRFHNPGGLDVRPVRDLWKLFRTPTTPWPRHVPVVPQIPPTPQPNELIVTFIGHATFLLQTATHAILTDPFWSPRASPVQWAGPKRVRAPGVRLEDLPPITHILLSHNHYDHCDLRTLRTLEARWHAPVITGRNVTPLLRHAKVSSVHELDWWDAVTVNGLRVTFTPAQHFAARGLRDRNATLWGGFHFTINNTRCYFAGDSGYGPHFTDIGARLGPIDLAFVPIGAYEPRWFMRNIHMNPEEAVRAHLDLRARRSIAMHFGTVRLTPEGIDEPVRALEAARITASISADEFSVMQAGKSQTISKMMSP